MKIEYNKRLLKEDLEGHMRLGDPSFVDGFDSNHDSMFVSVYKYVALGALTRKLSEEFQNGLSKVGIRAKVTSDTDIVAYEPQMFVAHMGYRLEYHDGTNWFAHRLASADSSYQVSLGKLPRKGWFKEKMLSHVRDIPYLDIKGSLWYDNPENVNPEKPIDALTDLGYNVTVKPFSEEVINALQAIKDEKGRVVRSRRSRFSSSSDGDFLTGAIVGGVIGASFFD